MPDFACCCNWWLQTLIYLSTAHFVCSVWPVIRYDEELSEKQMLYHLTQLQFTVWSWTRCGFFQGRRWAPLSGWLTVTQTLKYNDCWHCFLLSLTLNGPFQGSAKSIFFFIFFLGLCVKSFFFSFTQLVFSLSYLFYVCAPPDRKLKGTLSEGESRQAAVAELNRAHQSPRLQNVCVWMCTWRRGGGEGRW